MKKTIAIYGSKKIQREYCKLCKSWAFVIENIIQCCESIFNTTQDQKCNLKRMTTLDRRRKRPSRERIKKILDIQGNRCLYCDVLFGTAYIHPKLKVLRFTTVCLDHFIPYSYLKENKIENFVCACQICNGIKSNMMFDSIQSAKDYIKHRRLKKGYDKEERENN